MFKEECVRKIFLTVIATLVIVGCDVFVMKEAPFIGYNVSNDNIVALVNDGGEFPIPANRSMKFVVKVPVPKSPVGTITGPSSVDKVVQVSVAFRNLSTGKLTSPIFCQAGAKVVTNIWYERTSDGNGTAICTTSYSY